MHSKPNNSKTFFRKYVFGLVVMIMLSVFIMPQKSHAFLSWDWIVGKIKDAPERICNPTIAMFQDIANDQPQQSIIRFGYNYDTVRFLKVFYNVFGVSPDNAIRCISTIPLTNVSLIGAACLFVTGASATANCGNFVLGYNSNPNSLEKYASNPGNGSLISLYYKMDGALKGLGNPLDLNYFAYKTFERTPFVGRALAAQGGNAYGAPFVGSIYFAWVIIRNLAFGVFALLMLIVGVMMINRTRLNPQTVVTIQYALPKIIIAIILIAFSYPIGAMIVTIAWYIRGVLFSVVFSQGVKAVVAAFGDLAHQYFSADFSVNIGLLVAQILLSVFLILGVAPLALLIVLILCLIIVVQFILCVVKQGIYYVKMLMEVILSPVVFVYSAFPGNDDAVMGWFKKMLAYTLSIIVLSVMPVLVIFIALVIALGLEGPSIQGYGLGLIFSNAAGMIGMVAGAMVTYVGLSMTLKLPAQIEETLTGKKKRK
jgi:hypothetical protein